MFTAEGQRGIIIVLMLIVIGVLLFPERIRKAVLEVVTTEQTGREHDSESEPRPSPQVLKRASLTSASA